MKYLALVLFLILAGCAGTSMSPEGKQVRMLPLTVVDACEFISVVEAHYDNPWGNEPANQASVIADMKNQAALLGGDTIALEWVLTDFGSSGHAQVYKCKI